MFRANTDLLLLTTRLRFDESGKPHIPGTIDIWKQLFIKHPHGKYDGKLTRAAANWKEADDLRSALRAVPEGGGERAAEDLHGAERYEPETGDGDVAGNRGPVGAGCRASGAQYSLLNETGTLQESALTTYSGHDGGGGGDS